MSKARPFDPHTFGHWSSTLDKNERTFWVWEGMVARAGITLLTGASMLGKTTLVAMLLDRRRAGGRLLGRRVWAGHNRRHHRGGPVAVGAAATAARFWPSRLF